ncbi:MAG: hypothetical protein P1P76_00520 [Anaerolineales bacterium]|nr:hypothetical protein [Anaerolineales bacterium]
MRRRLYTVERILPFFYVLAVIGLAACSTGSPSASTPSPGITPSATIAQTPTPTEGPGEIILFGTGALTVDEQAGVMGLLEELAGSDGWLLRESDDDLLASMSPETRAVLIFEEVAALADIAHSHPGTAFITISTTGDDLPENVYRIRPHEDRYDQSAFLSGYVAALVTPDYRIGAIAVAGDGQENAALQGFLNGVVFYCGLCRPGYYPFINYPQSATVTSADPSEVLSAIRTLEDNGVTTVYLSPALNHEDIFSSLQAEDIRVIGSLTPAVPSETSWVATVAPDLTVGIQSAWDAWRAGEGGEVIEPPIKLFSANESLLSPGRIAHIQKIADDLASGRIDTAVDSRTGEAR